jgi:uncharacterized membrane protein
MIDARFVMRCLMSVFYLAAGILHLKSPHGFVMIVPSFVPWPETVVLLTGLAEIAGAIGLFIPKLRSAAGIGLALYAVCVFPANINHAMNMIDVGGLPNSWWYHGPRFLLQPILVWWALYCSRVINWPFK